MERRIFFEENEQAEPAEEFASTAVTSNAGAIQLSWPTDHRVITQGFAENPELYAGQGLPGHDGLDLRAPVGSKVYACAEGQVEYVEEARDDHNQPISSVRILHANGYRTLYERLGRIEVSKGQRVQAQQIIGYAGDDGGYIHLGLSLAGASQRGLTHYSNDIMDPTPFLFSAQQPAVLTYPWPLGHCLNGVNFVSGRQLSTSTEAVRLTLEATQQEIARLKQANPKTFFATSIHSILQGKHLGPDEWLDRVRQQLKKHADAGIAFFEICQTPNLASHGYGFGWRSGAEFAQWWLDAWALLKQNFPLAKFGFPALSEGNYIHEVRMDAGIFRQQADEAALVADWIGVQCYWENWNDLGEEDPIAKLRGLYPDKLIFVSEYGNVNALTNAETKAREHAQFASQLADRPGVGATFLSSLAQG